MGKTRVYCLIYDNQYIYLPIKAEFYPSRYGSSRNSAYLGLLPNIFGGKVEGHDSVLDTLHNEISQESQNNITINNMNLQDGNILNYERITYDSDYDDYYFWKADITGAGNVIPDFGTGNKLVLSSNARQYLPKCREMQCIIRVPINALAAVLSDVSSAAADEERVTKFLEVCGTSYGGSNFFNNRLQALRTQYGETGENPYTNWRDSGTKKAFVNYLRDLKGIERGHFTYTVAH